MKEKFIQIEKALTKLPDMVMKIFSDLKKEIAESREKLKDIGDTNYKLGIYHLEKRNIKDAILRFKIAMHFNKDSALLHYHLARCYIHGKKNDKAKIELEKALIIDTKFTEARYRLSLLRDLLKLDSVKKIEASINDAKNIDIPIQVIKEDFDVKAQTYEVDMIQNLNYIAPQELATKIIKTLKEKEYPLEKLSCLDLGCGTGIAGTMLKNIVALKTLVGVDISPNMLELAKLLENNDSLAYNELIETDLHKLEIDSLKFDIIMSCLGLDYSNRLDIIFEKIQRLANKNSIFAIISLKSTGEETDFNYDLESYSHTDIFWNKLFKEYEWSLENQEEIDIFNSGTKALLYILIKK